MYEFILLAALSASTFTLGKKALLYTNPVFLTFFRLSIAGTIFLGLYGILRKGSYSVFRNIDWKLIAGISFFSFFGGYLLEFWALQYLTSAKAALLYSFSPVLAAILSYISLKEKVTKLKMVGLSISVLGFFPALLNSAQAEGGGVWFFSWAELALFLAVGCFMYGWILVRKALHHQRMSLLLVNGLGMIGGSLMAGLLRCCGALMSGTISPLSSRLMPVSDWSSFLIFALLLIVIGNIACYLLYGYILKRYTATILAFGELLTPLFAALYGWIFLHEQIQWHFFVSCATILSGMALYYYEERRLGYLT